MNLSERLNKNNNALLSIYVTAGYPHLGSLEEIIPALEAAGVDFVEIGMPYSDPLCDGPVIQHSSAQALANGMTMQLLFKQLQEIETAMPLVVMGYFNNVFIYGIEKFCQDCVAAGVSGVILPDLPVEEYESKYAAIFENFGLSFIFLITPQTSDERIRLIDVKSTTFIYAVSTAGTTGGVAGIESSTDYLKRLQRLNLKHAILVGFHISEAADFRLASTYTQGGIIGSAFINHIKDRNNLPGAVDEFVKKIRS